MTSISNHAGAFDAPDRRQVLLGAGTALAVLAASTSRVFAMPIKDLATADMMRTSLHQEAEFNATPDRLYGIMLDSNAFAAFSGEPAQIDPNTGGAFSMFGARISGRNVELVPATRIVQAWRSASWDPGVYSIARFVFVADGAKTRIVLDHTGFPEGTFASLSSGWREHYWRRLAKYLG